MDSLSSTPRPRIYWRMRRIPSALVLAAAGGATSPSLAQTTCASQSTPIQVQNLSGVSELRAAVNCSDGGQLDAVWAGVVTLDAPISIGPGTFLSITGEDRLAEAQGGLATRMFNVFPGGGLALTQLKLSAGTAPIGGAIWSSTATLTLDGCTFEGNFATAGDGGAVWAQGGELTIIGGEFVGNSASGLGGAILAVDAALVIRDGASLERNKAAEGGALYCAGADLPGSVTATCSVIDAVFISNNASRETVVDFEDIELLWVGLNGGGAGAFLNADVDVTNCVFNQSYAQLSGGALFGGNSTDITIDGCAFTNNTTPGYGGAIAAYSTTVGGDTQIMHNFADRNGGGVSV